MDNVFIYHVIDETQGECSLPILSHLILHQSYEANIIFSLFFE